MGSRPFALALLSLLAAAGFVRPLQAANAVVGTGTPASCNDATLTAAVALVNQTPGGTVTFNCGGPATINVLTQKTLDNPAATCTIDGGGRITLNGQDTTRIIFHLGGTLTVRGLILRNGRASGLNDNGSGGAIRSDSGTGMPVLYVDDVTFLSNATNLTGVTDTFNGIPLSTFDYGGGAVYTRNGYLTVTSSRFTGNTANNSSGGAIHGRSSTIDVEGTTFTANASNGGGFGGAIYVDGLTPSGSGGTLYVARSTFTDNTAYNIGGAFYFYLYSAKAESVTIDTAEFLDNQVLDNNGTVGWVANRGIGGGGVVDGGGLTLLNTTFAGNRARSSIGPGTAGGLSLAGNSFVQITNSTFSGNRAEGQIGAPFVNSSGGGLVVYNTAVPFQISHSTIANNYAWWTGGGIDSDANGVLTNTIVANNVADNGGNPWNIMDQCSTQLANGGGALQFPDVIGAPVAGNPRCANAVLVADPRLDALARNGGFAQTHALMAGSAAINAVSCVVSEDQREVSRPQGPLCDIGSFEVLTVADLIFADGFE